MEGRRREEERTSARMDIREHEHELLVERLERIAASQSERHELRNRLLRGLDKEKMREEKQGEEEKKVN